VGRCIFIVRTVLVKPSTDYRGRGDSNGGEAENRRRVVDPAGPIGYGKHSTTPATTAAIVEAIPAILHSK
jgi:hypothetical protein